MPACRPFPVVWYVLAGIGVAVCLLVLIVAGWSAMRGHPRKQLGMLHVRRDPQAQRSAEVQAAGDRRTQNDFVYDIEVDIACNVEVHEAAPPDDVGEIDVEVDEVFAPSPPRLDELGLANARLESSPPPPGYIENVPRQLDVVALVAPSPHDRPVGVPAGMYTTAFW